MSKDNSLDKTYIPSVLSCVYERRMQTFVTWLLTMADKSYQSVAPDLYELAHSLLISITGLDFGKVSVKRLVRDRTIYGNVIELAVDEKKVMIAFCEGVNDFYALSLFKSCYSDIRHYYHKKILFTSLALPTGLKKSFPRIIVLSSDYLLTKLKKYDGANDNVLKYRDILKSTTHKDFLSIPMGLWDDDKIINFFNKIREDFPALQFEIEYDEKGRFLCYWYFEELNRHENISFRLWMPIEWWHSGRLMVKSIDRPLSYAYLKKLIQLVWAFDYKHDIYTCHSRVLKKESAPKYEIGLEFFNSDWLFNVNSRMRNTTLIDCDVVLARFRALHQLIKALSQVPVPEETPSLPNVSKEPYPTLDL